VTSAGEAPNKDQAAALATIIDPALFADSNHLATAGRELYTQRFAAVLSGFLRSAAARR
jgi:hypothetical protein